MMTRSDIWSHIKSIANLHIFNSMPNSLAKETYFLARNSYLKSLVTGLQNTMLYTNNDHTIRHLVLYKKYCETEYF